jgi:hypothetical protein
MDIYDVEAKVNACLALPVRNSTTVAECVGGAFVEKYTHLAHMLCDPKMDLCRLLAMLEMSKKVSAGETDQETASEKVGLEVARQFIDVVRHGEGRRGVP